MGAVEIADFTVAFKDKQVVYQPVHEIPVVGNHHQAAGKILQEIFQHLQRHDVQVVGRLVEDEEVGIFHQHREQVQTTALPAGELADVDLLLGAAEQEALEQLRRCHLAAFFQRDHVGDIAHGIDHAPVLAQLDAFLTVVAEDDGIADHHFTGVGRQHLGNDLQESGFAGAVGPDDADPLLTFKLIGEMLDQLLRSERLADVMTLHDFAAQVAFLDL